MKKSLTSCWGRYAWLKDTSEFDIQNHVIHVTNPMLRNRVVTSANIRVIVRVIYRAFFFLSAYLLLKGHGHNNRCSLRPYDTLGKTWNLARWKCLMTFFFLLVVACRDCDICTCDLMKCDSRFYLIRQLRVFFSRVVLFPFIWRRYVNWYFKLSVQGVWKWVICKNKRNIFFIGETYLIGF